MSESPQEAARELLRRRKARRSLLGFTEEISLEPAPALHHRVLLEKLQDVIDGTLHRLMVFMPPGSAKSTYCSVLLPAYYLGVYGDRRIIAGSYDTGLSTLFGRRVRNLVGNPDYQRLFPIGIAQDSRAKGEWDLESGGGYYATGVGSAVTGRRGNLGILDDLIKGRKEADSQTVRDSTWEWYVSDFRTRLIPDNNAIVYITCMTGDTMVALENGAESQLKHIRPGDRVKTYRDGKISASTVLNWRNSGPDKVFRIRTTSGIIVRANARHPFLVDNRGKPEWIRVKNLSPGQGMYRVNGGSGKEKLVFGMDATNQLSAGAIVRGTTGRSGGQTGFVHRLQERTLRLGLTQSSNTGMALTLPSTMPCWKNRAVNALYVYARQARRVLLSIGETFFAWTIATRQARLGGCSAMTATWSLAEEEVSTCLRLQQPISDFTLDPIESIEPDGVEDVFDIEVEGTGNFIANGIVSHNTRWHEDDPAGRLLPEDWHGESGFIRVRDGETWYVLCVPAEARQGDPIGRRPNEWLWPEWFSPEFWTQEKRSQGPRNWSALYQQIPSPDEGTYFKREWFKWYSPGDEPIHMAHYMAGDFAVTDGDGDFTEIGVVGIDPNDDMYVAPKGGWYSGQTSADKWIDALLDLAFESRPDCFISEKGVIRNAVEPFLDKRSHERRIYVHTEWLAHIGDKAANARAFQARASSGRVYLPDNDIGHRILNQLLSFPAGKNDDIVDVLGLIGRYLQDMRTGYVPKSPTQPETDAWGRYKRTDNNWKTL